MALAKWSVEVVVVLETVHQVDNVIVVLEQVMLHVQDVAEQEQLTLN